MRFDRAQVIVLSNQKGGCGKTTTAVNLSAALSLHGYRTCLADIDGQCNATTSFGIDLDDLQRQKRPSILDVYLNRRPAESIVFPVGGGERFGDALYILPGHRSLGAVPHRLEAEMRAEAMEEGMSSEDEDEMRLDHRTRLRASLDSLKGAFDIIIIDTPPELGFLLSTALGAADWFIIPVFPSAYDMAGLERLMANVTKVRRQRNPDLRLLGVLVGNFDKTTVLDQEIYDALKAKFNAHLSPTTIRRGVRLREAAAHGLTIFEHDPQGPIAAEFEEVADLTVRGIRTQIGRRAAGAQIAEPQPLRASGRANAREVANG